ncbi:Helix-turn-helix domain-containing protein [Streptomyces sp. DvalAA-14]|uniref:helix-turn-helix domain-containing protein n=1 Tax=unclassified Streptomyces TaxID=2593676 RepID=UPI00081B627A|nr:MULTISPECIES: helix-turn-helix transcriptional regulator [unclassified Streptomyces]MYS22214.1 helix-turn-helix domain-containing protein [Streptomyces sp. SID4948]SCE11358.1 Helix-turn-helix domain-containing protein [Streptomyces sp. DvalAA-14]
MTTGAGQAGSGTEDQDWEEGADDILKTVGRQVKLWRERAGLKQAELGQAIGYSEEQVSSVERGRRAPKPEFLDGADEVLGAGGILAAFKEDVERARYPKKVRDLAKLEADAVAMGAYSNHNIHGLLQTEDYTRALYRMRRPLLDEETIERYVAARMARQDIFTRWPAPILSFVQEEVTLRRPIGGRAVLRVQLERLLEVGQLRNVEIQVMPTDREDHAGMGGQFRLLDAKNGPTVGHVEVQNFSRLISNRSEVRTLEAQYGIIRAQALTPRESLAFIEKVLGAT